MKSSNDPIGNRTRDLPVCSAVPETTESPRVPFKLSANVDFFDVSSIQRLTPIVVDVSYIQIIKNAFASHMLTKNSVS